MANGFAHFMLIAWPLIAFYLSKKLRLQDAAVVLALAPYLFLPEKAGWDLPGLPPLHKGTIPALTSILIFYWSYKYKGFLRIPDEGLIKIFSILLFLFPFFTLVTNLDAYSYGARHIRGLSFSDLVSMEFSIICRMFIPFVIGWRLLSSIEGHRTILKFFVIFGLFYTVLMLWEIRMSPQLHRYFYGVFPHSFLQQIRQGGFRPVVFLGHGLLVAIFCAFTLMSVAVMHKSRDRLLRGQGKLLIIYTAVVLVLCKTIGAIFLAVLFVPCILFLKPSKQLQIASVFAMIVLFYPLLRAQNVIPVNFIVDQVQQYDEDRAGSLRFRVMNEDVLLEKASDRLWFGWGGWGRNRIYDPKTGNDLSVTDGFWIIVLGVYGWVGYIAIFGILTYPIIRLRRFMKQNKFEPSRYTSGVALILVVNLIDLLPNSSFSILSMLLAGSLFGKKENFVESVADSQWMQEVKGRSS